MKGSARTGKIVALVFGILAVVAAAGAGLWYYKSRSGSAGNQATPYEQPKKVAQTPEDQQIIYFSIWSWQAEHSTLKSWDVFLDDIKSWGANTIITDIPWMGVEKSEGQFDFSAYDPYLDHVRERGLNLILVLDTGILFGTDHSNPDYQGAPKWLFEKYPDARSQDFDGTSYPQLSFTHKEANQKYQDYLSRAVRYYNGKYGDHVLAYNPNFNNQMETRFAQQGFKWQDYGPTAQAAYREWLQDEYGSIDKLNARWRTSFSSFEEPRMLAVNYNQRGFDPDVAPQFIDVMKFREHALEGAVSGAADAIKDAHGKVYLHFGEVLTKIDAIFTSPLELLAKYADVIAVDCHHLTGDGSVSDPSIVGLMVSHARANGATVIYEDSVEPIAPPEIGKRRDVIVRESIRWAFANGATGLGFANFLHQWEKDGTYTFQHDIKGILDDKKTFSQKPVALYGSRWLPFTMHSTNDYYKDGKSYDPWQTNVQGMFKLLEDAGVPVAVLSDEAIAKGMLDQYDALVMPYMVTVPEETLAKIKKFNEKGGALLQDMRFAEFSLTGERDASKIESLFGVRVLAAGGETSATVSKPFTGHAQGSAVTIGDADLLFNSTSGLLTTNHASPQTGTTTYLETASGAELLAVNPGLHAAFMGYLPGLLYLHHADAQEQKDLQNQVLFALEQIR